MGVLNRKKAGGGAAAGPGAEFFNAAEASQLNTLLRGEGDPEAKPEDGPDDSKDPGAATEPTVRARVPRASPPSPREETPREETPRVSSKSARFPSRRASRVPRSSFVI
jgi:hypothetical protein